MAWTQKASSGGGGDYQLCPAGNQAAQLTCLFDVGTHSESFGGETKENPKVVAVFQLAKKDDSGHNYIIGERYTMSLNSKAKLRPIVEGLLGRSLVDGEELDPRDLIGKQCLVNIVHDKSGDKTYHNISGVTPLPDGFPEIPADRFERPIVAWGVDDGHPFPTQHESWLPYIYGKPIFKLAEESLECKGRSYHPPMSPPPRSGAAASRAEMAEMTADIPF